MEPLRGEAALEFHRRIVAEETERRREMLANGKRAAEASGKQPFDLTQFLAHYRPQSASAWSPADLEYTYYVVLGEVKTLEDFARQIERSELYEGGDLRWD